MLGRLTGNVWVEDSQGERVDIGLAVKNAKQGLCVPGGCCSVCSALLTLYGGFEMQMVGMCRQHFVH
jgi:hypothetical protein